VAALSLVLAPSIGGSLMRPAAAAEPMLQAQKTLIAKDAVGDLGEGGDDDQGAGDNGNGNGLPPGARAIIGGNVGATKQFALDISAQGKVSGSNALAKVKVEGTVSIDSKKGTILKVQDPTGSAEIQDKNGNVAATLELSNISFKANGAKVTVTADFTDQDDDKGKFTASLFADKNIDANSAKITLQNQNNKLSIKYDPPVNQQFVSTGNNVEGELSFT